MERSGTLARTMKAPDEQIQSAIMLAITAHWGQTDKAGLPYILHPLRVMSSFVGADDGEARIVAVLHDVIEDTDVTLHQLRGKGYSEAVVAAIDALSRRKGEPYKAYIKRVSKNKLATRVKMADLLDNLSVERPSTQNLHAEHQEKYRQAVFYLA